MFSSNATQVSAVTQAEAVDFDGTNDYLRRTSDLTGNTTSKTFTFSAWIWQGDTATSYFYVVSDGTNQRFVVRVVSGTLSVEGTNNSNSVILTVTAPLVAVSRTTTFYHVLISMDMANAANRSIYINDVVQTLTVTTYTNAAIPFNQVDHVIAGTQGGSAGDKGRLSNVFLDYTYRDMSITANRRLFITADLKPAAGQAALNPILYLPMSDPTTVATNAGTGGNFTLNGTVARSGRGPNQYNAPYSALDGAADFLSRTTAPTGIADSKTFTAQFVFRSDNIATGNRDLIAFGQDAANPSFFVRLTSGAELDLQAYNAAGSVFALGAFTGSVFKTGRNYVLTISVDLSDTAKRHVYINGEAASVTWSTYLNLTIDFNIATTPKYNIAKGLGTVYYNGQLGAVWFNTSYIDLSVASNLAKFVSGTGINAAPVDLGATGELPTGTAPLIYLPMYGNNAGKNYGTGGDFTVNSGPYTGARGPNEFWGNGVTYSSTGSTLSNTSGDGASSSTFTFSVWLQATGSGATAGDPYVIGFGPGNSRYIYVYWAVGSGRQMYFNNFWTGGTSAVSANFAVSSTGYTHLLVSKTGNTYQCYVNGVSTTMTVTGTVGNWVDGQKYIYFGSDAATQAAVGELFLTTQYFDLSQEANRLIFRDCFGNPTNLPLAITNGTLTNPKYYLRFAPSAFGANAGTGGNFTTTGTLLDKGQY